MENYFALLKQAGIETSQSQELQFREETCAPFGDPTHIPGWSCSSTINHSTQINFNGCPITVTYSTRICQNNFLNNDLVHVDIFNFVYFPDNSKQACRNLLFNQATQQHQNNSAAIIAEINAIQQLICW